MPYEFFEHTADIGLRVQADDLKGLFLDAAAGFYDLVTDYPQFCRQATGPFQTFEMNFQEENAEELYMRWLQELLFFFSARKLIAVDFQFATLTPMMVKLKAGAVRFDPKKHVSRREVKAVTHHGFRVLRTKAGWEAEVIFDI